MIEKIMVFLANSLHVHERMMADYLRSRNWVVFYLEPEARKCNNGECWMRLYEQGQKAGK